MVCSNIPWRSTKSSSEASHLRYRVLNEISPVLSKRHRAEERGDENSLRKRPTLTSERRKTTVALIF